jgi:hypothetical protein
MKPRLADAHHRHARLGLERLQQLLGADDAVAQQHVADALLAQTGLLGQCVDDLCRRGGVVGQQLVAQARAELERDVGAARAEHPQHGALVASLVDRREKVHAVRCFDVADRLAAELAATGEVHGEAGGGVEIHQCAGRAGGRAQRGAQRLRQRQAAELRGPQRQRRARRRHLHLRQAERRVERDQPRAHGLAVQAQHFARLVGSMLAGARVDGVWRCRPGEGRVGCGRFHARLARRERVQLIRDQGQLG